MDVHCRMRHILGRLRTAAKAGLADAHLLRPVIELRIKRVGGLRHVREQQLNRHLLADNGARAVGRDLHAVRGMTAAGRREHALAFDFHHAGAAVAVRPHTVHVAEARDVNAALPCDCQERFAFRCADRLPVEGEGHHHSTSPGKYLSTESTGLGAAWPSPQIDASIIACDSSSSSGLSQRRSCIRCSAFCVPTRQGVHWPHDSSAKNLMTLRAAAAALSLSDSTTIAAEPMKQPYGVSVSKSSGTLARDAGRIPPDAPPGRYAYSVWPSSIPPQYSSISSASVMPAGAR